MKLLIQPPRKFSSAVLSQKDRKFVPSRLLLRNKKFRNVKKFMWILKNSSIHSNEKK